MFAPVWVWGVERLKITEGQPVQQEGQHGVGEAVGEHRRVLAAVHLQHNRGHLNDCVLLSLSHSPRCPYHSGRGRRSCSVWRPCRGSCCSATAWAAATARCWTRRATAPSPQTRTTRSLGWRWLYLQFVHSHLVDITCQWTRDILRHWKLFFLVEKSWRIRVKSRNMNKF